MVSLNSSAFLAESDELLFEEELVLEDEEEFEDEVGFFEDEPVLFVTALGNLQPFAYAFPNVPSA